MKNVTIQNLGGYWVLVMFLSEEVVTKINKEDAFSWKELFVSLEPGDRTMCPTKEIGLN